MTNDRIHAWLDGDLPGEALTPDEHARAAHLRAAAEAVSAHLRAAPAPDLSARVMAALPPVRTPNPLLAWLAWLWSPRPVRLTLRPAYGLAFAALAALALFIPRPRHSAPLVRTPLPGQVAAAPAQPRVYVQFRVEVPNAHTVALAGSFTGWQPRYELRQTGPGEWSVLVPLRPGVHDYAFVVDGRRWMPDPHAPQVDDSFGGTNSRISLPPLGAS